MFFLLLLASVDQDEFRSGPNDALAGDRKFFQPPSIPAEPMGKVDLGNGRLGILLAHSNGMPAAIAESVQPVRSNSGENEIGDKINRGQFYFARQHAQHIVHVAHADRGRYHGARP
jgi:hypothetical protein